MKGEIPVTEKKNIKYVNAMRDIQAILKRIESGSEQIDIDELITDVEKAASLISFCKRKLYATETKIQTVLDKLDEDAGSQS